MSKPASTSNRAERSVRLKWVPIEKMRVSPQAQREQRQYRIDALAADFDLEQLGTPTVNERDGWFWIIDGAHRIEALKAIGWGDQQVQCWTYDAMSIEEEAEMFLKLNDVLVVSAMEKFKVSVVAGRATECDIDRVVRAAGLHVSSGNTAGSIGAVSALRKTYSRGGPSGLAATLRVIRDAYGDAGFSATVLHGAGLVVARYGTDLEESRLIEKLGGANGGVNGLLGRANVIYKQTGQPKVECVAAAAVEFYNSGRGGKKIQDWWRADARAAVAS